MKIFRNIGFSQSFFADLNHGGHVDGNGEALIHAIFNRQHLDLKIDLVLATLSEINPNRARRRGYSFDEVFLLLKKTETMFACPYWAPISVFLNKAPLGEDFIAFMSPVNDANDMYSIFRTHNQGKVLGSQHVYPGHLFPANAFMLFQTIDH